MYNIIRRMAFPSSKRRESDHTYLLSQSNRPGSVAAVSWHFMRAD